MYDITRRIFKLGPKVKDLIELLGTYPPDAEIVICGDTYCYIHVEQDDSTVCIDNEDLDECYGA